jgi:hypothetical protein
MLPALTNRVCAWCASAIDWNTELRAWVSLDSGMRCRGLSDGMQIAGGHRPVEHVRPHAEKGATEQ